MLYPTFPTHAPPIPRPAGLEAPIAHSPTAQRTKMAFLRIFFPPPAAGHFRLKACLTNQMEPPNFKSAGIARPGTHVLPGCALSPSNMKTTQMHDNVSPDQA